VYSMISSIFNPEASQETPFSNNLASRGELAGLFVGSVDGLTTVDPSVDPNATPGVHV
jgi:hypothetical protein